MKISRLLRPLLADSWPVARIIVLAAPVFAVAVGYMHLNIETAILRRRVSAAVHERDELERRNRALRSGLSRLAAVAGEDPLRWRVHDTLPLLEQNEIVRIQLPELPEESSRR
ncbi:MAG: hypothetical protein K1X75_07650 [Leptospirales bacterium]|nr:hypothetical protein [Leptospirales bacterium]